MTLIDQLIEKYNTISLIGMVKNAGKTTLLNELIDQAYWGKVTLGLTSIGYDGEKTDSVTNTPKPTIEVFPGALVATAQSLLNRKNLKYEVLEITDLATVFGPIVIVRIRNHTQIELIGPRSNYGIEKVSYIMKNWGAKLVLIDGALDRVSTASPALADAVFLSTGAALSRDMNQVVNQTVHRINLLRLKKVIKYLSEFKILKENNQIGIIDSKGYVDVINMKTAINAGSKLKNHLKNSSEYIFFPGAVTYNTLKDVVDLTCGKVSIVVSDGSKLFIDRDNYYELLTKNLKLFVLKEINLVGVSVNPFSPKGYYFDSRILKQRLMERVKDIEIINVFES
ncbi:MAG: hypothetical protein J7L15_06655 [Clostridiales bacterium]|nr:hypothetical protein [Clostridiales bacterium]